MCTRKSKNHHRVQCKTVCHNYTDHFPSKGHSHVDGGDNIHFPRLDTDKTPFIATLGNCRRQNRPLVTVGSGPLRDEEGERQLGLLTSCPVYLWWVAEGEGKPLHCLVGSPFNIDVSPVFAIFTRTSADESELLLGIGCGWPPFNLYPLVLNNSAR